MIAAVWVLARDGNTPHQRLAGRYRPVEHEGVDTHEIMIVPLHLSGLQKLCVRLPRQ